MITAEEMATLYWQRMNRGAIREVGLKLLGFIEATPTTKAYWLKVQEILLRKAK